MVHYISNLNVLELIGKHRTLNGTVAIILRILSAIHFFINEILICYCPQIPELCHMLKKFVSNQ
jgi:hypothetical protein